MAKKHGHHLPEYRNRGYLKYKKSSRSFRHRMNLIYVVEALIKTYWNFKTDFDNRFIWL